jgi:hypothetical protein
MTDVSFIYMLVPSLMMAAGVASSYFFIYFIYFAIAETSGRSLYRWTCNKLMSKRLARLKSMSLASFIVVVVSAAISGAYFDGEQIDAAFYAHLSVIFIVAGIHLIEQWSIAEGIISSVKKTMPKNSGFRINETRDACWIYSSRDGRTFRTVLCNNSKEIKVIKSYETSEKLASWQYF